MAKQENVFYFKTFCLITGASKGLGRCLALRFSKQFPHGSALVLLARSVEGLENTKKEISNVAPGIQVFCHAVDLSDKNEHYFNQLLSNIFVKHSLERQSFQQSMIVHNAGSLGDVSKKMTQQSSVQNLQKYWDLNLSSVVVLNSVFVDFFKEVKNCKIQVMNISSICALQPFKSWSVYCAGKAARDMLFRTMAEEEGEAIRVLNYAPGPIDTDMQLEARTVTGDEELKTMFAEIKASEKLLSCDQSVNKLIALLEENKFESGAHIDYYDI